MPKLVPAYFKETFTDVPNAKALASAREFMALRFEPGYKGEFEVARRKDSPNGSRVNLCLYTVKENFHA